MDVTHTVDEWGSQVWKNKIGQLHRNGDSPAIVYLDGTLVWYKNGKFHRVYGPAAIWVDGYKKWSINLMISY